MGLCHGGWAAHCAAAVVRRDNVTVSHVRKQHEVVVVGFWADVHHLAVPPELITGDDAVGLFRWGPVDLHRLWASDLREGTRSKSKKVVDFKLRPRQAAASSGTEWNHTHFS